MFSQISQISPINRPAVVHAGEGRSLNVLGHTVNVMLGMAETQGGAYVFEVISPVGALAPPHMHMNEDEYGYIVEGLYEISLGEETFRAGAGAVLFFPRLVPHGLLNIGATIAKMIWVSTPGARVEAFFQDLSELPADLPPDMQKLLSIAAKYEIQLFPPRAV
jgi:mannose-6-phosphate isomerase-like protein (cupin superfamily)